jgi:hypothetical protein
LSGLHQAGDRITTNQSPGAPAEGPHPEGVDFAPEAVAAAAKYIGGQIAAVVAASGASDDPEGYGQTVARDLFPDVLSYVVGTPAVYGFAARNGRTRADNAPEAMLSLVTNTAAPATGTGNRAGDPAIRIPACGMRPSNSGTCTTEAHYRTGGYRHGRHG